MRIGGAREAAEALLGRPVDALAEGPLPGRLELRGEEVWDGAHTPEAVEWLLDRLPEPRDYVVVAAILADKDADGILERLARAGRVLVATRSSNHRSLPAGEVADRARTWFPRVETAPEPRDALHLARSIAPRILVTGSLYLLADLTAAE